MTPEEAQISVERVKAYLGRVISRLMRSSLVNGLVPPETQATIRYLQSKQREQDREWFLAYGTEEQKERARIEKGLARPDNGELIQLGERNHGVGRLDCRACEFEYREGSPESKASLCGRCHRGIRHVYQKLVDTARQDVPKGWGAMSVGLEGEKARIGELRQENDPVPEPTGTPVLTLGAGISANPNNSLKEYETVHIPIYRVFWTCDSCGAEGMEK